MTSWQVCADCRPPEDEEDRFAIKQPEPPEPVVNILTKRPVTTGEGLLTSLVSAVTDASIVLLLCRISSRVCKSLCRARTMRETTRETMGDAVTSSVSEYHEQG